MVCKFTKYQCVGQGAIVPCMGVRPQTNLGGHQIFARKICHCNSISKKKKRSSSVSLHLICYFWTKHAIKRGSKVVLTFFFFGDAIAETNFSAKMYGHLLKLPEKLKVARNFYSNCPKNYKLPEFKGGQCPPGPPTSYAYGAMPSLWSQIELCSKQAIA